MHHSLSQGMILQVENHKERVLPSCLLELETHQGFQVPNSRYILNGSQTIGTNA